MWLCELDICKLDIIDAVVLQDFLNPSADLGLIGHVGNFIIMPFERLEQARPNRDVLSIT